MVAIIYAVTTESMRGIILILQEKLIVKVHICFKTVDLTAKKVPGGCDINTTNLMTKIILKSDYYDSNFSSMDIFHV